MRQMLPAAGVLVFHGEPMALALGSGGLSRQKQLRGYSTVPPLAPALHHVAVAMENQPQPTMNYYWVTFNGKQAGSLQAASKYAAKVKAEELTGAEVTSVDPLPYPADPKLDAMACPSFCTTPSLCKGRTSCPKNHSCSE